MSEVDQKASKLVQTSRENLQEIKKLVAEQLEHEWMTLDRAFNILQSAVARCRVEDVRTPGIYGALTFLESRSAVKWPFDNFRTALVYPRSSNQEKEAYWQELNTWLGAIRRCMDGIKSE